MILLQQQPAHNTNNSMTEVQPEQPQSTHRLHFTPFFIENILQRDYSPRMRRCSDPVTETVLEADFSCAEAVILGGGREEPLDLCKSRRRGGCAGGPDEPVGGIEGVRRKKLRTTFTGRQIYELEKMFENKKYLNSKERSELSRLLNVTEQQVKIWFQNRRTKWKKHEGLEERKMDLRTSTDILHTSEDSRTSG